MKKTIVILMLLLSSTGFCQQFSDYYGNSSYLYPEDPNAGTSTFRLLLIPAGGEREAMGTAYTAVARDTGYLESNPAGGSLQDFTQLTFVHNNWIEESKIEGIFYTIRSGRVGFGAGGKFLYTPFRGYNTWGEAVSKGYFSESIGILNIAYTLISNYAFPGLSVGLNAKTAYRNVSSSIYQNQSFFSIMADIGVLARFNFLKFYISREANTSIGITLKNFGAPVRGDPLPTTATVGIAYSLVRPLVIDCDFSIPFNVFSPSVPSERWSIASGVALTITDFFSLNGGFQLKGGNPRFTLGGAIRTGEVTLSSTYTLDLATQLSAIDRLSLEARVNLGDRGRKALRNRVESLYLKSLDAFAAGNLKETIRQAEMALELDPLYSPAQEMYRTASRTLELQQQMEELQVIEKEDQ